MKKNANNLLEYILIAAFVAVVGYVVLSKFSLSSLKNYVFIRGTDPGDTSKIKIEAMTQ